MNKQQIRGKLWRSLDMACLRFDLILCTAIPLLVSLMTREKAMFLGIMLLLWIPMWGWGLWKTWKIFRKPEEYTFTQAKLCNPHGSIWRHFLYFTVLVEDRDGNQLVVNTDALFRVGRLTGPQFDEYTNKTVTIGYNGETGSVVVLG